MTMTVKLSSPRVRVLLIGEAEPLDLQTNNSDLVLWDRTRGKHKWPKFDDAPFLWLTFLSWAAARRTGAIEPGTTFESWEASVIDVEAVDDDEDDDLGRPTDPAPVHV